MSKTQRKTSRRKPAAKPSTALVRRQPASITRVQVLPAAAPAPVQALDVNRLTEETALGALGLSELKLTAQEEAVLAEPVDVNDVRMKPSGQPYVSHPTYTRWFNRAFGRLGWTLVPASKPVKTDKGVARDFLLYVHGKPVAFATGEQDYHANNTEQTYADALEACFASALRRCAKRLGVGLELWDKPWLERYVAEHCVRVKVKRRDGKPRVMWRRAIDPPLPYEIGAKGETRDDVDDDDVEHTQRRTAARPEDFEPRSEQRTVPQQARVPGPKDEQPITRGTKNSPGQVERLWVIIRNSGRNEETIREWLLREYNYSSTREIKRKHYDEICKAIEARGPLPAARRA